MNIRGAHTASRIKVSAIGRGLFIADCSFLEVVNGRMDRNGKVKHYLGSRPLAAVEKHRGLVQLMGAFPYLPVE